MNFPFFLSPPSLPFWNPFLPFAPRPPSPPVFFFVVFFPMVSNLSTASKNRAHRVVGRQSSHSLASSPHRRLIPRAARPPPPIVVPSSSLQSLESLSFTVHDSSAAKSTPRPDEIDDRSARRPSLARDVSRDVSSLAPATRSSARYFSSSRTVQQSIDRAIDVPVAPREHLLAVGLRVTAELRQVARARHLVCLCARSVAGETTTRRREKARAFGCGAPARIGRARDGVTTKGRIGAADRRLGAGTWKWRENAMGGGLLTNCDSRMCIHTWGGGGGTTTGRRPDARGHGVDGRARPPKRLSRLA